jgi:hypothetical protein
MPLVRTYASENDGGYLSRVTYPEFTRRLGKAHSSRTWTYLDGPHGAHI